MALLLSYIGILNIESTVSYGIKGGCVSSLSTLPAGPAAFREEGRAIPVVKMPMGEQW
jgi:hypothetical protein